MSFDVIANSRILTRALRLLGLWPISSTNDDSSLFNRYYRFYQIFMHVTFIMIISVLLWLNVILSDNLKKAFDVLKFALSAIVLCLKIFNMCYYAPLAAECLHEWQISELMALRIRAEEEMWQRAQNTFRKHIFTYCICCISVVIIALSAFFLTNQTQLPFEFWIPLNWREYSLWPAFCYQVLACPFISLCIAFMDLLQCYLLLHLKLYLNLIGMRLERLGDEAEEDEDVTRKLVTLIHMHHQVKSMLKSCEKIISLPVLTQIILSSLIICFIIHHLQSKSFMENPVEYFAMFQYVLTMALQVYLPCYFANELTVQSVQLSHHLYCCEWTGMSAYNRRLILIFSGYLQQPMVLYAGNYFPIGLGIFVKVMNNAYTLLALVVNVSGKRNGK